MIGALDLRGSMVSIDATGCQIKIAQEIIDANADYLLAVKANQGSLYEQASDEFTWVSSQDFNEEWEYDHGRYERRKCSTVVAKEMLSPDLIEK